MVVVACIGTLDCGRMENIDSGSPGAPGVAGKVMARLGRGAPVAAALDALGAPALLDALLSLLLAPPDWNGRTAWYTT
jgi:hypothetical protein